MKRTISFLLCMLIVCTVCSSVFASGSIKLNIKDGDTLAGVVRLNASGGDALSFVIDGTPVKSSIGKVRFAFTSEGMEYAGGKLLCGKTELSALPSASGKYELELDQNRFSGEDVVLTYIPASSEFDYQNGSVYGTYNLDDQTVGNVSLFLPNGDKILPSYVVLHYPVIDDVAVTDTVAEYAETERYNVGDGWYAETNLGGNTPDVPIYISFVFESLASTLDESIGYVADFDTSVLSDGMHTLEVTSGTQTVKTVSFATDNTPPEIDLSLAFGSALYADSTIEFSASDPAGEVKLYADIDGERYFAGRDLRYLTVGKHLFTLTATDLYGNVSIQCAEFYLCEKANPIDDTLQKQTATPSVTENGQEYVYDIGDALAFTFAYCGTTVENGPILIELFDNETNAYAQLGVAHSGAEAVFEVTDARYITDGCVKVRVSPYVYTAISDTVVWITDTQYYSNFEDLNNVYELILNYSVELYQDGKAGYLIHTGDIVDTHYDAQKAAEEWKFASETHNILDDAGMPNGALAGNHDTGNVPPDFTNFKKYFGKRRFADNLWYGGQLGNNICHYDLLTIAGTDYLFMYLGNGAEADAQTVAWANAVCKAYANRTVIICVHAYLGTSGNYISNPNDTTAYNHSRAKEIAKQIIAPNPNVAAVLCGHEHGAMRVQRDFGDGRYVWEILSDYQYAEVGTDPQHEANGATLDGEGYLRLITFGADGLMQQTTYSPLHDDYNFFADDQDTFELQLQVQKSEITVNTTQAAIYFAPTAQTLAPIEEPHGIPVWVWIVAACAVILIATAGISLAVKKRS